MVKLRCMPTASRHFAYAQRAQLGRREHPTAGQTRGLTPEQVAPVLAQHRGKLGLDRILARCPLLAGDRANSASHRQVMTVVRLTARRAGRCNRGAMPKTTTRERLLGYYPHRALSSDVRSLSGSIPASRAKTSSCAMQAVSTRSLSASTYSCKHNSSQRSDAPRPVLALVPAIILLAGGSLGDHHHDVKSRSCSRLPRLPPSRRGRGYQTAKSSRHCLSCG
jgi:hypothetical protein